LKIIDAGEEALARVYTICNDEDLEDAIQISTAPYGKVDIFLTADKNLAKNYGHLLDIVVVE
jgi:hypothetical protein